MPFCPCCGVEYRPGFSRCVDCELPLSDLPPATPPPERRANRTNAYLVLGLVVSMTVGSAMAALTMCGLGLLYWRSWLAESILAGIVFGGLPLGFGGGFVLGILNVRVDNARRCATFLVLLGLVVGGLYGWAGSSAVGTWMLAPASALAGGVGGFLAETLFDSVAESWWRWWSR